MRVMIVGGVIAIVFLMCATATETGEDPEAGAECNERCQEYREKTRKFVKEMKECRKMSNFTNMKGSPWPKENCSATFDESHVKAMVCWNRLKGIFTHDYLVNVAWWNSATQDRMDRCIAYNQMILAGETDRHPHTEWVCKYTKSIGEYVNKCLREGQAAEKDNDKGESAMLAMMRCYCLVNAEFLKNRKHH